ncbi:uncharacterized protein EI90DRAFT_3150782 [Cantharellus anzutake]|uniref:uncharacterized protein n=1 Tax=Cantharellus anzutake TaxID=1750568 RepID=UPI00190830EB|nr:uncharacterized protein EI90DRAFT_3150782 [Cantharellus anzutake]KAF8340383.1 hypothetical protein EI90DRAFT_3150782 [Cantharellus anzutake]
MCLNIAVPVAPPTPQEIQRKLSVHATTSPAPITPGSTRRRSTKKLASGTNVSSNESDSDAGPTGGSYFPPQVSVSPDIPAASLQPPLSVITERRSPSGEESDEDEEESEWRPGELHENEEAHDESVVKSGYLWKKGERRKTWKKRWFVLRPTKLAYYKNDQEYQCLRILHLGDIHTVTTVSLKRHNNTFGIVTPTRTFYIQAPSLSECDDWVNTLNDSRNKLKDLETPLAPTPIVGTPRGNNAGGSSASPGAQWPGAPPSITTTRYDSLPPQLGAPVTPTSPIAALNLSGVSSDSDDPFTSATGSPPRSTVISVPQTPTAPSTVQGISAPLPQQQSSSKVVLSGYLMKCGSKRKTTWRKRWFTLSTEKLSYAKSHMEAKHVKHVPLVKVVDAIEYTPAGASAGHNDNHGHGDEGEDGGAEKPGLKHTFKIITTERGAILLCAPSEEEEIRWLSAVRALTARRRSTEGRPH